MILNYYKRWTTCEQLTNDPVKCDEFEQGRKSHVINMPMGFDYSLDRIRFNLSVKMPAIFGIMIMKSYND